MSQSVNYLDEADAVATRLRKAISKPNVRQQVYKYFTQDIANDSDRITTIKDPAKLYDKVIRALDQFRGGLIEHTVDAQQIVHTLNTTIAPATGIEAGWAMGKNWLGLGGYVPSGDIAPLSYFPHSKNPGVGVKALCYYASSQYDNLRTHLAEQAPDLDKILRQEGHRHMMNALAELKRRGAGKGDVEGQVDRAISACQDGLNASCRENLRALLSVIATVEDALRKEDGADDFQETLVYLRSIFYGNVAEQLK